MAGVKIVTDFADYYDNLSDDTSKIVYTRRISDSEQRVTSLDKLRKLSIKTIDIKPVNQYIASDGKLVVYTNPKAHNGRGKKVLTVDEAAMCYSNYCASRFYEQCKEYIKFIQVGKKRFTVRINRKSVEDIESEEIIEIIPLPDELNRVVALPIFSIDYICIDNRMVATDFNEVEILKNYKIDTFIKPEDIILEIRDSLVAYNKV